MRKPTDATISRRDFLCASGCLTAGIALSRHAKAMDTGDRVWEGFQNPPSSARPFVRWWWNGDKLDRREILRELDMLKIAGIGGVEINPIQFPSTNDPLNIPSFDWLSPEWCEMVRVATDGAKERDMTTDIIVGSGWPFGGRFLPREHQTKILSVGRHKAKGPGTIVITASEMFANVSLALYSKNDTIHQSVAFIRMTPAALDRFEPGVDITSHFKNDTLTVEVPPGDHIIHYFVVQEGFQAVINGAPGSDGPVLNHFNRESTLFYLNHMSNGMKPHLGKLGDHFRAFFCDSLELEGANWNEDMLPEFQRRRGYDLLPWLPYMLLKTGHMGETVKSDDTVDAGPELADAIQRVRYDYWLTLIELFRERFIEPYNQWCHAQGVQSRIQAYGHGYDPLDGSMLTDIPEGETWLQAKTGEHALVATFPRINRFVASGARLNGKRLVSCEEVTNTSYVFFTTLQMVKIGGDESFLSGITHSILHGFNYSPPEAEFPGWVRYGTYFSERNPWWPFLRHWTDYKARISWLFQQGEACADIAILHPLADLWQRWGMQRDPFPRIWHPWYSHFLGETLQRAGHNCDYTNENILCRATMDKGEARYRSRRYRTILLMEVDTMRAETAAALERFVCGGGRLLIIGKLPSTAPGLLARGSQDETVRSTMTRLAAEFPDRCHVVTPPPQKSEALLEWFLDVRERCHLVPDVQFASPNLYLSQIRYRLDDGRDVFFVANTGSEKTVVTKARFTTGHRTPWLWDAETGERRTHPWDDQRNELTLHLEPAESRLIVFEDAPVDRPVTPAPAREEQALTLAGIWHVHLKHVNGSDQDATLATLQNIHDIEGQAGFAGTATYRINFQAPAAGTYRYLDLGVVHGISTVILNGRSLGCRWYGRHQYTLPMALKPSENNLEVCVTTVLGNYCKTLTENATAQRWTKKLTHQPIGMLGPVRFLRA